MDLKEETCEADLNIIKLRIINVKEEDCDWETVHPKQESLDIKEEDSELGSVSLKEEDEEECISTEMDSCRSMESVKEDDLHYGDQDGAVTGLVSSHSRYSSSPESSVGVQYESLQSDTKGFEDVLSSTTEEGQPPPKTSSETKKIGRRVLKLPGNERCAFADSEKLPCGGSSSITQVDCEANNCCYDSSSSTSPCYYANDVTVQCTLDGQFVVVVSENVTLPTLNLGSIQLVDSSSPSCSPVTSLSSFVMYQFPVSACGSTVQLAGGNVTYQNTMSAAITVRSGPEGSITRDSVYKLFFQCTYSGSQDVQVEAEVYTVAPPLPVVEQGPFDLELVIATDPSYGSYYVDADYPVTKTLRDPVAVEVHIVNRTDPNLVLTLGDCWVTPGPSASSQPQWSLLVNGCPYMGDNYLTSLVTVDGTSEVAYPSHYKRFVFEMFAFVDPVARQALAEKVGFVAKGNPALFLWSCMNYFCGGLQFGFVYPYS
ncbi:ZP4 protein, partial [Polypterus senegalus]